MKHAKLSPCREIHSIASACSMRLTSQTSMHTVFCPTTRALLESRPCYKRFPRHTVKTRCERT